MIIQIKIQKYIAEPYWPELCQRIEVDTKSRIHRIRNDEKRVAALDSYLDRIGQTQEWYDSLKEKEKQKFYTGPDGNIVIPEHQMRGMLLEGIRSNTRLWKKKGLVVGNFRVDVGVTDFATMKRPNESKKYDRYIKNFETNMRRNTISEYIEDFVAVGEVTLDGGEFFGECSKICEDDIIELFKYSLRNCGIGGARKMGYGRGVVLAVN